MATNCTTPFRQTFYFVVVCLGVGLSYLASYELRAAESSTSPAAKASTAAKPEAVTDVPTTKFDAKVEELYKSKQLLKPENYAALRRIVARKFVIDHGDKIRVALGEDYEEMKAWFAKNMDVFDDLCIAIHEQVDNVEGAFKVFNQIRKKYPNALPKYGNLAIATAVVWDDGSPMSRRMTDGTVAQAKARYNHRKDMLALDNFGYFVENEKYMHNRALRAPWEMLTYVVFQRTPMDDRQWVLENFGEKQSKLEKAYFSVPYDEVMFSSRFQDCKLRGKDYTLNNILTIGGVCVQQSDYTSRIAQNLAIPAQRVEGRNDDTRNHEWARWIEFGEIKENSVEFKIEESGRYKNHNYFVGRMVSPQSGGRIYDYEFAVDFEALGINITANRQARMALRVFSQIVESCQLDVAAQITFANDIIARSPKSREAWLQLAKVIRNAKGDKTISSQVNASLDKMVVNFAEYPDFAFKLLTFAYSRYYESDIEAQAKLYERMATVFEKAKRRDLVCEMRVRRADIQIQQEHQKDAIATLASCVMEYPDEGRYVPVILDKIEQIAASKAELAPELVQLYKTFLPAYFKAPGRKPTSFSRHIYERAAKVFADNKETTLVDSAKQAYEDFKAGKKKT